MKKREEKKTIIKNVQGELEDSDTASLGNTTKWLFHKS